MFEFAGLGSAAYIERTLVHRTELRNHRGGDAWTAEKARRYRLNVMVRKRGLEPLRYCYRQPLKLVRLPFPPLPLSENDDYSVLATDYLPTILSTVSSLHSVQLGMTELDPNLARKSPIKTKHPANQVLARCCDGKVRLERLASSGVISARAWIQGRDVRKSAGYKNLPQAKIATKTWWCGGSHASPPQSVRRAKTFVARKLPSRNARIS